MLPSVNHNLDHLSRESKDVVAAVLHELVAIMGKTHVHNFYYLRYELMILANTLDEDDDEAQEDADSLRAAGLNE